MPACTRNLTCRCPVIAVRKQPTLARAAQRAARSGELVRVLPGIYVPAAAAGDLTTLAAAVCRYRVDATVLGAAAAALSYWSSYPARGLTVAGLGAASTPLLSGTERRIDRDWRYWNGFAWLSHPALTALDLVDEVGGDGIDMVLRTRAASLADLNAALRAHPNRPGNNSRRRLLLDSRAEPWSAAERRTHVLFRRARITGWTANHPVPTPIGLFYLDLAFRRERVAVEIDGRSTHDTPAAFQHDRTRQNALVLAGWLILRFTWQDIIERPDEVIAQVRAALAQRRTGQQPPKPGRR